jgi:ubiquinone/menaquinone biosynthesis C-methylase UbiE
MRILDLGCGDNKHPGATGVDIADIPGVDVVWDLDGRRWPLPDSSFDLIIMRHILEHLESPVETMLEAHRVAAPNAVVEIVTPHFSSANSWSDPTHRHHFAVAAFDYFIKPMPGKSEPALFFMMERRLTFAGGIGPTIGRLLAKFDLAGYEKRSAFKYPARNIHIKLGVRKSGDASGS